MKQVFEGTHRIIVAAALLCVAGMSTAQIASAGSDTDQVVKYYRKKSNVGPAVPINVGDVKDSQIKGAKQGAMEIGNAPNVKKVSFTMSPDARYVIFGDVEDVTIDPFKKVMEKINLKGVHTKGPANAKVTIVEYSDFQCPFCTRGYATIENQVLKEYGDKVKFAYRHFPLGFHPWAEPAAIAVECAGLQSADAYWKLYSYYFDNQKDVNPQNLKEKSLAALPEKADKKKFEDCFDNKKTQDAVKASMAEGQSVGVTGTPAFIINGRLISGAQPFEAFKNIIEDELASK